MALISRNTCFLTFRSDICSLILKKGFLLNFRTVFKIDFGKISIIYFLICYNNVNRYGKRFLSRIFADNFYLTLKISTLNL